MTEEQWLTGIDPVPVWEFLAGASERKLRLHAVACCRRVWHLLADSRSRDAVGVAERLADGQASGEQARAADIAAEKAHRRDPDDAPPDQAFAARAALFVCRADAWGAAKLAASCAAYALAAGSGGDQTEAEAAAAAAVRIRDQTEAEAAGAAAVRLRRLDIFGNPFRPVAIDPAWRTPDVLTLAPAAYENRTLPAGTLDPARLALLADALEDSGCIDAGLLGHLRGPSPHFRGCFALDLLLGKE
jgi:hypothetical protein